MKSLPITTAASGPASEAVSSTVLVGEVTQWSSMRVRSWTRQAPWWWTTCAPCGRRR